MSSDPRCRDESLKSFILSLWIPRNWKASPQGKEHKTDKMQGTGLYRTQWLVLLIGVALLVSGCPKSSRVSDHSAAHQAPQDPDAALDYYEKALKANPTNADYKIQFSQARWEACQLHIQRGQAARLQGKLQTALGEFQRALAIDPSDAAARQEFQAVLEFIGGTPPSKEQQTAKGARTADFAEGPPEVKPLSTAPINLRMSNDAKVVYDTIGKLAGLTVIYDPDFVTRRISVELTDITIEQALDVVSLEAKAFWKPVTQNIIMAIPDQTQKRRDYEEQVIQTYYLSNAVLPQDLTEIVTGLRQLLDLKRIQQVNSQNAIVIRDTPGKLALAEKIIHDLDNAKPEVVIQVEVLQARTDRTHQLGIAPGSTATLSYSPPSSSSTTNTKSPLSQLGHLATNYSVTLPGATLNALLSDSNTRIIENPELRSVDGQPAKLRVGDRVPVATGSFQAGSTTGINPLVNTQFQYIDVGVNADITPHIHPNQEVSLKVAIEVSSVTGSTTIGGIQQPIISQRKIEHEIRLKDGEVSILGGLFEQVDTKTLTGWPGLGHVPVLRYLFATDSTDHQDNEVLIVLIPRIVRLPALLQADLRPLSSGSETNIQVRRKENIQTPVSSPTATEPPPNPMDPSSRSTGGSRPKPTARIAFAPAAAELSVGLTANIDVVVENIRDLYSIPLLLQYDPRVVSIEDIHQGSFLPEGTQEVGLVQRVDKELGQAVISVTRQPNTAGVNGSGTLLTIVVRGIGPGLPSLSIVQVNPRDSKREPIAVVTGETSLTVKK
jgi:general secretion pathway protein D